MINYILNTSCLLILLLLDGALSMVRSAFANIHPAYLKQLEEENASGARLAVKVANDGANMAIALRAFQGLIKLFILGIALFTYATGRGFADDSACLVIGGTLIGAGLAMGLVEFMAENLAMRDPTRYALRTSWLATIIRVLFLPIGRILRRIGLAIAKRKNVVVHLLVTEEEIMTLVDAGEEEGAIEEDEKAMIRSIFRLDHTLAREVMLPRIDISAFEKSTSLKKATEILLKTGHSRAPVYDGSIDNIIGLLYSKDLLAAWQDNRQDQMVTDLLREAYFVPESKKVDDLLAEMQAKRIHMAIVVDEYGGTAGVVTMEDIVEEIVGEIRDEYDEAEEPSFQRINEGEYLFAGGIDLDDVNQLTGAHVRIDMSDTLGGFIYSQLGRVPVPGESVEAGGLKFTVEQVAGRRICKVRAQRIKDLPMETEANGNN